MKAYIFIFILVMIFSPFSYWFSNFFDRISITDTITNFMDNIWVPRKASLYFGWDIMLSRSIWYWDEQENFDRIFSGNNYNPVKQSQNCKKWECVVFFNLESPFSKTDNNQLDSTFSFQAHTWSINTINQLTNSHPSILSLANNHIYNAWYEWIKTTQSILKENDILWVWAWTNQQESRQIKSITKNNIKMCFGAYSYDWRTIQYWNGQSLVRNSIDVNKIEEDIQKMEQKWCDANIISLHWWREYKIEPTPTQQNQAHKIIDAWADLILGHHSHVPWKIEKYNWKYIFYSLGNFIFDQDRWRQNYWENHAEFDTIWDHKHEKWTVPTYIWLNWIVDIYKTWSETKIELNKLKNIRSYQWILERADKKTWTEIINKIKSF